MAISVAPLTTVVMNAVGERYAGTASGVNNAAARVAGLLAVAALGAVAVHLFAGALQEHLLALDAPEAVEQAVWAARHDLAGTDVPSGVDRATRQALEAALDDAFVTSFRGVMGIAAGLALLGALCAGVTIPPAMVSNDESAADSSEAV